jgi:acetate kinase
VNVLALNAGSSTLKYKLFQMEPAPGGTGNLLIEGAEDHADASDIVKAAESAIERCQPSGIDAIGHRIVHGGSLFSQPTRMTPEVLTSLRSLKSIDPLHNPAETAMIEAGMRMLPTIPDVGIFDTAFHHTLPETAWRYALPRDISDRLGLRRYGFHGISHGYISKEISDRHSGDQRSKLVSCHLGSGASICAILDGKSVDTTMGMTPLEGLVMGTRSGDVDPGLLLYLLSTGQTTIDGLADLLNNKSGLAGLSGSSSDIRQLEKAAGEGDIRAELSLEIFAYRASKYIGAYAVALEGLDFIAFTGGIGEHSPKMRDRICRRLLFLGVELDEVINSSNNGITGLISRADARVKVWVVPANEELEVARQTAALLSSSLDT